MNLTKNFSLAEMTRSRTASRRGISNQPDSGQRSALLYLCETVLQPARDVVGPITITSGFRSAELNAAVGGAVDPPSRHTFGEAADIVPAGGHSIAVLFQWLYLNTIFDQLIWEFGGDWVHVSATKNAPRRMCLRTVHEGGSLCYRRMSEADVLGREKGGP